MNTILYLDQNYVSYLTKARLGVKVYPDVAAYYENLYDALREAVQANTIVCPASPFHYSESERDTRLAPEIYRTLAELSRGVEFRDFEEIIQAQAAAALNDPLGMPRRAGPRWREAFNKDPHRRLEGRLEPVRHDRPRVAAQTGAPGRGPASARPGADLSRARKALHEAEQRQAEPIGSFQGQKRSEARRLIDSLQPLPAPSAYVDLPGREPTPEETAAFLRSEKVLVAPFIDVYSSLRAAMALDRERKPRGSDLQDVLIAATVIPYCDVFATDGHMKQLIVALKLDQRYGVRVFGSRKADVVALTTLVRGLPPREQPGIHAW